MNNSRSNQTNIEVVPTAYSVANITSIQISVSNLILFTSVTINVILMSNIDILGIKTYTLVGSDYTNWMNDDSYITNYTLTQLGLTAIMPEPVPTPEPAS
jgi:hypothetical protein